MSTISDGIGGHGQTIQDISKESANSIALDFIEKNELAKGTSVQEINMYDFYGKAFLAGLKLANGQQATVVISKVSGGVIGYEGDVEKSAYDIEKIKAAKRK